MTKEEYDECLEWLVNQLNVLDDREDYNHDYKIIKLIWSFMRAKKINDAG